MPSKRARYQSCPRQRPGNFSGPKANFKLKTCCIDPFYSWNGPLTCYISYREFKQRRRRRQRERQKRNKCRLAKQQLCTCITLFCTLPCRRCTTTTWKCLISCFVEDVNTRQRLSFSFAELWYSLLELISSRKKEIAIIWRIERVGISAIMFEVARIHFLSTVSVAVALVIA